GVTTRDLFDPSRPTPENHGVAAHPGRSLPTEIWYPAVPAPGSPTGTGVAVRDARLDPSGAPYPLVLFVHGSTAFRTQSTFLTTALAAAGYVVAAADFPLTAVATPGGPSELHFDDQVSDLSFIADQLAAVARDATDPLFSAVGADGYVVVGHSTGG